MKHLLNNKIFSIISQAAFSEDVRAYVVGGFVRDLILKRGSKDIDIVVEGSGIQLAEKIGKIVGSHVTVFKNFGTAMLKFKDIEIEFVGARKESYNRDSRKPIVENGTLEEDQLRRDFTINAMAIDLSAENYGNLIDPFSGIEDLKNKVIRTPLDPNITFSDDPLRMLRAVRFATQLDFTIDSIAFEAIKSNKHRLSIVSGERIADEINKIILTKVPSKGFFLLEQCGILEIILPQLVNLKGVESVDGKGHKDNFSHTLKVLDNIAKTSDDLWLRWAALLHDVGKPATKSFDPLIGWTFHGHDYVGYKMIPSIFKQMKLPLNEKMKFVQKMVLLHLRPISLAQEDVSDSAIRRLLFEAGDDIENLMLLCEADITSKNAATVEKHRNNFQLVRNKLIEVEAKDAIRNFQNPITGEYIMERFSISPGREVGELKEYIKNAILDGIIGNNFEDAEKLLISRAKEMGII